MEKRAHTLLFLGLAAAAAIGFTPAAANAQALAPAAMSSVSFAKSEAILGGSRSRLAEILAQQKGVSLPAATLRPASLRRPSQLQELVREYRPTARPAVSPAIASGRPDLFGSVALSVGRTPLDRRWRKVEQARVGGASAAYARSLRGLGAVEQVEAVNRYVNGRVRFVDDSRQHGRADLWSAAADTLSRGRGDCEDYAIAKLQMLRAAGFADRDLYLVVVKDLVRRADHAVLVVRTSGKMLMLDNGTDVVADAETVTDYRPVLTFAANGAWTHGYRRASPPVRVAQASIDTPARAAN